MRNILGEVARDFVMELVGLMAEGGEDESETADKE